MFVDVTAVLDDGARPWADWVPRRPRCAVELARGQDATFRVRLVRPTGTPVQLGIGSGDSLVLTARTPFERGQPGARRVIARPGAVSTRDRGAYDVVVPGLDTRYQPPQRLAWDLWVLRAAGAFRVMETSLLNLVDTIADLSGAPDPAPVPEPTEAEVRRFVFTWPATAATAAVAIPGDPMPDASYMVQAAVTQVPAGGAVADLLSDPATQTAAGFTLTAEGVLLAGTLVNIELGDLA